MIFDWEEAMEGYFRLYLGDDRIFHTHLRRRLRGYYLTIIAKTGHDLFGVDITDEQINNSNLEKLEAIESIVFTPDNIKEIITRVFNDV